MLDTVLTKRFVVEKKTPSGWLAIDSDDELSYAEQELWVNVFREPLARHTLPFEYRIYDQKENRVV